MKVGDLVFRKRKHPADKIVHISDYCYDGAGLLVSLKNAIGVVLSVKRDEMPLAINPGAPASPDIQRRMTELVSKFDWLDEPDEKLPVDVVWVAWTPEISSLEKIEDLNILEEGDLDPFTEGDTDA